MKGKQIKSIIKEAISSLKRINLKEQIYQVPLTGQCSSNIALTINSVADVPTGFSEDVGQNFRDYMASLPPNSTVKITTDDSVTSQLEVSNLADYAVNQYNNNQAIVFAYEPQITDFSQPWNPQYAFITNGNTGYPAISGQYEGVYHCSYTTPQLNNILAIANPDGNVGNALECDDLVNEQGNYVTLLLNMYPDLLAEACATNNLSILSDTLQIFGVSLSDGFGIGYANAGNAYEIISFYCSCPQIPDYEPEPIEPDPVEPDPVVPDPVVPDPTTLGGVKPGGDIPTLTPLKGPAKPGTSTTATPMKGKIPMKPGMKPMREQVERMQKLANIKNKK